MSCCLCAVFVPNLTSDSAAISDSAAMSSKPFALPKKLAAPRPESPNMWRNDSAASAPGAESSPKSTKNPKSAAGNQTARIMLNRLPSSRDMRACAVNGWLVEEVEPRHDPDTAEEDTIELDHAAKDSKIPLKKAHEGRIVPAPAAKSKEGELSVSRVAHFQQCHCSNACIQRKYEHRVAEATRDGRVRQGAERYGDLRQAINSLADSSGRS